MAATLVLVVGIGAAMVMTGGDSTDSATPMPVRDFVLPTTTIPDCSSIQRLVTALQDVESKLTVGITYDEYRVANQSIQVAYDAIDFKGLPRGCLDAGVAAEEAHNLHRQALTSWKACLDDALRCPVNSSKAERQRLWSEASDKLAEAKRELPRPV
ncbi:MAG: hypothetical protein AB1673_08025 [Actinomycetota bacterium]